VAFYFWATVYVLLHQVQTADSLKL